VLCSGFARFVMRHDRARRFRLLAAQSPLGAALYRHYGLDPVIYDTNILLEQGIAWFKSEAGIRIVAALGFPYTLARLGRWVPWRDALYAILARNRLRWFGSRGTCFLPDPADRDRFLA
jgi:predicted DCC family thiol-disulfide oxidoreductase YuxK